MTPWVTRLVIANIVLFVLTSAAPVATEQLKLVPFLILSRPWTLVTYMFLHANVSHILFNMLGLFFFGPRLEIELGGRQFLWLYFISGLSGALLSMLQPHAAIIGASGAVFGVMLGFARYWPRVQIYIWGILPVEARMLVIVLTGIELLGVRGIGDAGVAHFAHLGGFLGAFLYLKWSESHSPGAKFKARATAGLAPTSASDVQRWRRISREGLHPINRDELDRVLAKVDTQGASSLTPDERAFLNRLSAGPN